MYYPSYFGKMVEKKLTDRRYGNITSAASDVAVCQGRIEPLSWVRQLTIGEAEYANRYLESSPTWVLEQALERYQGLSDFFRKRYDHGGGKQLLKTCLAYKILYDIVQSYICERTDEVKQCV